MSRPIKGHVEFRGGRWKVQATDANGERAWHDLPASILAEQRDLAQAVGTAFAVKLRAGEFVPSERDETVTEYFGRYLAAAAKGEVGRKNRGRPQAAVAARRSRFESWIEPEIGHLPMRAVGPAELRGVVRKLDDAIRVRMAFYRGEAERHEKTGRKPGISHKSAQNIWSEVTNGFQEACSSKIEALRVRPDGDNPATGVRPPLSGDDREQAALYPAELVQLLACAKVSLARRRVYAVAAYTGMRRSELERLEVGDVDFGHALIKVRGQKTVAAKRTISIEPALRPLLETLVADAQTEREVRAAAGEDVGPGLLLDVPRGDGKGGAADLVRSDLVRAGVARVELTRDDDAHMPFTFHGLRHTCITHWVVGGKSQLYLLTAGGHTDAEMTKRYLAAASSLSATFGTPHPELPADVRGPGMKSPPIAQKPRETKAIRPDPSGSSLNSHGRFATPMGIEPMFPT